MIDRRYNRTADTGRFEMIHRGTPVPVPIYVGIDLRVEGKKNPNDLFDLIEINLGKVCKTGRPANLNPIPTPVVNTHSTNQNISPTTNNSTSAMALLQTAASSPIPSSSPHTPGESRPAVSHPASALATQPPSPPAKNFSPPVTLKLRREMTQPVLSRAELVSSMDAPLEKLANNDMFPIQYRSNIISTRANQSPLTDQHRSRHVRINGSRLSADYFPVRQVSRSRVNDRLPSPKGKIFIDHFRLFLSENFHQNSSFPQDLIASFDLTRLPTLPVRSQHFNRLVKQRLIINSRKARLSLRDEQSLFSSLIITARPAAAQE